MDIKEPIILDGRPYSPAELDDHCHLVLQDPETPHWKEDILSFILQFLDSISGEIVQKTSGTTGDPKTHMLNRDSMIISARKTLEYFGLKSGDKALLCLPVKYVAGKMMVVRALVGGLDLVMVEPSSRPVREFSGSVTFAAMVPLQLHESILHNDNLSVIEKLLVGGGELQASLRERLTHMLHPVVYESFGMTETYTHFAIKRINGQIIDASFRLLEGVSISQDERDCLIVDVPGITARAITTNDLVEIESSGDGFSWLGRYDHVINSGGIKIIPEYLEQQIRYWIGQDCLVIPETDEKLGQRLVLLIEYADPDPPIAEWIELLHKKLSIYEIPNRIITIQKFPRNQSMKIDRGLSGKLID